MIKILVLTGPTATGKTGLSVSLAKRLGGEIISADSMQIYKGMQIGTAAATPEEQQGVAHHMIGAVDPASSYSVSKYQQDAMQHIRQIALRGHLPILVGGTGLYIDSILYDFDFMDATGDERFRQELHEYCAAHGNEALHARLAAVDADTAARLHPNDEKRVIRALEVHMLRGESMRPTAAKKKNPEIDATVLALECSERAYLYERIDRRVDIMLARGLLKEVENLLASVPKEAQSMKAIGYRQLVPCIEENAPLAEAIEQIKRESRRYAKRQLTWLRTRDVLRIDIYNKTPEQLLQEALQRIGEKNEGLL